MINNSYLTRLIIHLPSGTVSDELQMKYRCSRRSYSPSSGEHPAGKAMDHQEQVQDLTGGKYPPGEDHKNIPKVLGNNQWVEKLRQGSEITKHRTFLCNSWEEQETTGPGSCQDAYSELKRIGAISSEYWFLHTCDNLLNSSWISPVSMRTTFSPKNNHNFFFTLIYSSYFHRRARKGSDMIYHGSMPF